MTTISLVLISLLTICAAVGLILTGQNWADADQIVRSFVGKYDPDGSSTPVSSSDV